MTPHLPFGQPVALLLIRHGSGIHPPPDADLTRAGFRVNVMAWDDAPSARLPDGRFDLALLDVAMPDVAITAQALRRIAPLPLVIMSDRSDDIDRIVGLEQGADDFVTKPCHPRELTARIRNILKPIRTVAVGDPSSPDRKTTFFGWTFYGDDRVLTHVNGTRLRLAPNAFRVLTILLDHAGRIVTRQDIQDLIVAAGHPPIPVQGIAVVVNQLRTRLFRKSPFDVIQTVHGTGYRMRQI